MTRVAVVWHMHQPFYQDLVTGEHILPWVRLHAIKDYYGMVALLREFPDVKVTFNLVPSLLVQLEAFAGNRAQDRALELSLKSAADLTPQDVDYMRANFFHAQRQRMIDVSPRYAELLAGRSGTYSVDDLRDLQVWHKLAWIDPSYQTSDPRVRMLLERGRGYSEADKALLRDVELEILNRVIPEYRAASERGQIEIAASPFYHPILPLLCDTDIYLRTHPDASRPRRPFTHPEDAAEQLTRAADYVERMFGRRPTGLWPSEGSVSEAMVPLAVQAGFAWMATDELILARSLDLTFSRDAAGQLEQPERLYTPYRIHTGGTTIACAFRDHVLSDLIGFTYSGWAADAAATDFTNRLAEAGRRFSRRAGGEEALITIILDGENAWEHFEGGGRPFLRALYHKLGTHAELRSVTMSEGCADAAQTLTSLFPGSWIDGNFYIWIGHSDDQKAWSQLADARAALDIAPPDAPDIQAAREEILIAEGSDWCWWYGDDHSSAHDADFDELYRRHLRNAYQLSGQPIPDELFVSNISSLRLPLQSEPTAWLTPTLDGEETSYFEWLGAGVVEVIETAGAMHQTTRQPAHLTAVRFGFDRERLYVRIDAQDALAEFLADGFEVALKFLEPAGVRYSVQWIGGQAVGSFWDRLGEPPQWHRRGPGGATVVCGRLLELAVPFADLAPDAPRSLSFFIAVYRQSVEQERHPAHRPITVQAADPLFEARHWRV